MQDKDSIGKKEQGVSSDEEAVPSPRSSALEPEANLAELLGISKSFSGPLPPPEVLKAYDLIKPGLAEKIFDLAKRQAEHRMELEKAVVLGDGRRSWTGLVLGFVIACVFLGSSTYIIIEGHDLAGGLLAGGGLVSLVSVFVYGTNLRAQERAEKRRTLFGDSDGD